MGEKKNKIWQHGLKPKEQNMKHLNNNLNSKRWNNIPTNFEIEKGADNLEVKESLSRIGKDKEMKALSTVFHFNFHRILFRWFDFLQFCV